MILAEKSVHLALNIKQQSLTVKVFETKFYIFKTETIYLFLINYNI